MKKKEDLAAYLFHEGTNFNSYRYMGVHETEEGFTFRVWAPHARAVFVVGDFNGWREDAPMERITEKGIFEAVLPRRVFGGTGYYKYKLYTEKGVLYKGDPFAFRWGKPPETACLYENLSYHWGDEGWLSHRDRTVGENAAGIPVNIYEVHLGSFCRHEDGRFLSYPELAAELLPYLKEMGYTHVELMPVTEHPFDGSWGYQVTGYFAPTARYGSPSDFMAFVDTLHQGGVGVILDVVPAHFPKDAHGLFEFDGGPLYEYQGKDRMEHPAWGTRCFDVGREEVQSFLISAADFWAAVYHADGLRVDAVASMLYLDCDRDDWVPNIYGDNRNLEAIAFFKKLNGHMRRAHPHVMMIAEESGAFQTLTARDGLGFTAKWNMGWMNDMLSFAATPFEEREAAHRKLTFSMMYAFGERYLLPISHDEVVHGKKSFLDRMVGTYDQKFSGARLFLTYMMTHPGMKLLFMGCEIGMFAEWDEGKSVEWFLLSYPRHRELQHFVADLNHFYLAHGALYEEDTSWRGFQWMEADHPRLLSYCRRGKRQKDGRFAELLAVFNLIDRREEGYPQPVPRHGRYRMVFSSDATAYGGGGWEAFEGRSVRGEGSAVLLLTVPPLTGAIFTCTRAYPRHRYRGNQQQKKRQKTEKRRFLWKQEKYGKCFM